MDLNSFFTVHTGTQGTQNGISGKIAAGSGLQGLNFVDIILARLLENAEGTKSQGINTPLESDNPLLTKTPGLKIPQLLAVNEDVRDHVDNFITSPSSDLSAQDQILQTLLLNQQALDATLKPLTGGIITTENVEKGSPRLLQALMGDTPGARKNFLKKLEQILAKLEKLAQAKNGDLTLVNLTAEQLSQLKTKIADIIQSKDSIEAAAADADRQFDAESDKIAAALIEIMSLLHPAAVAGTDVLAASAQSAAQAGNTVSGGASSRGKNGLAGLFDGGPDNLPGISGTPSKITDDQNFSGAPLNTSGKNTETPLNGKQTGQPQISSNGTLQNLPGGFETLDGNLLAFTSALSSFSDPAGDGSSAPAAFSLSAMNSTTSLVTNAPSAGSPHPATQTVAASIMKNASPGFDRSIMIQLDPPELGRVAVRLSFNTKDKGVKAVVVAERSETVAMLQRDAHVLERALESLGLDSDGGLTFELASDNQFNQDGGHDGSNTHKGNNDTQDDENIIESKLVWQVDSATGHMRYSILA